MLRKLKAVLTQECDLIYSTRNHSGNYLAAAGQI